MEGDVLKSGFSDTLAVEMGFDDVEVNMLFVENYFGWRIWVRWRFVLLIFGPI